MLYAQHVSACLGSEDEVNPEVITPRWRKCSLWPAPPLLKMRCGTTIDQKFLAAV